MEIRKRCPTCGSTTFHASAVVRQTWLMNADGTRQSVLMPVAEVIYPPSDDGPWTCAKCGRHGTGREFNTEAQAAGMSPRTAALSGRIEARRRAKQADDARQAAIDAADAKKLVDGLLADDMQDQVREVLVLANQAVAAGIGMSRFKATAADSAIGFGLRADTARFAAFEIRGPSTRTSVSLEVGEGTVRGYRTDDSHGRVQRVYCEPPATYLRQFAAGWPAFRERVLSYLEEACPADGKET